MEPLNFWSTVIALVSGGTFLGFLTFLFKQARAPVDDWEKLVGERNTETALLREEIVQLKAEVAAIRADLMERHAEFLQAVRQRDDALAEAAALKREIEQMRLAANGGSK